MKYYLAIKNKENLTFSGQWIDGNRKDHLECCNPDPERHIWYLLTYKCILTPNRCLLRDTLSGGSGKMLGLPT